MVPPNVSNLQAGQVMRYQGQRARRWHLPARYISLFWLEITQLYTARLSCQKDTRLNSCAGRDVGACDDKRQQV